MTGSKLIPDSLEALQDIWSSRQKEKRARWSISQYVQAGMLGRDYGQLALANDVLVEAAARYPKRAKIEYVHALILAEGGAREAGAKVEALLDTLPKKALIRPDTLALKGRIAKDRYAHLPAGSVAAKPALRKSIAAYAQAYAISGDPFHGINEASTRRMAGESRRSCQIAQTLKTQCLAESNRLAQPDRWVHATIAEASLLLGHHRES